MKTRERLFMKLLALCITTVLLAASLAACGGKAGGDENPTAAGTSQASGGSQTAEPEKEPDPEYVDYVWENGGITIQIPWALKDVQPSETEDGLLFENPDGSWLVRYTPLSTMEKKRVQGNLDLLFGPEGKAGGSDYCGSISYEQGNYGSSDYTYTLATWDLDTEKNLSAYFFAYRALYPHVAMLVDFGQRAVGAANALLVEVTTKEGLDEAGKPGASQQYQYTDYDKEIRDAVRAETATRENYPTVASVWTEETKRLVNNMTFAEGIATRTVEIDGVVVELPTVWEEVGEQSEKRIDVAFNQGADDGGVVIIQPMAWPGSNPAYIAELASGKGTDVDMLKLEDVNNRLEELKADGTIREYQIDDKTFYATADEDENKVGLYTWYKDDHCLELNVYLNKASSMDDVWNFVEGDIFTDLLKSMEIDVTAYVPTEEDIELGKSFEINKDGAITGYTGEGGDIVIPAAINGVRIVRIGSELFKDHTDITSVVIPEGCKEIGAKAFQGCSNLTTVVLPMGLEKIEEWAFSDCTSLTEANLPETIVTVERNAFEFTKIPSLYVPGSMKKIEDSAFANMYELREIIIGEGVEEIGNGCFNYAGSRDGDPFEYKREAWEFMPADVFAKYPDKVMDPETDPDVPFWVNITVPGTVKKIDDNFVYGIFVDNLYMTDFTSVEDLPDIYYDEDFSMFNSCCSISTIIFTEDTINKCGPELEAHFLAMPDGHDRVWYELDGSVKFLTDNWDDFADEADQVRSPKKE